MTRLLLADWIPIAGHGDPAIVGSSLLTRLAWQSWIVVAMHVAADAADCSQPQSVDVAHTRSSPPRDERCALGTSTWRRAGCAPATGDPPITNLLVWIAVGVRWWKGRSLPVRRGLRVVCLRVRVCVVC